MPVATPPHMIRISLQGSEDHQEHVLVAGVSFPICHSSFVRRRESQRTRNSQIGKRDDVIERFPKFSNRMMPSNFSTGNERPVDRAQGHQPLVRGLSLDARGKTGLGRVNLKPSSEIPTSQHGKQMVCEVGWLWYHGPDTRTVPSYSDDVAH